MDILEALAAESDQIGLSALSERVDLHTATVHRLLSTLTARGYARHDARSGQYAPGPQLLTISLAALGARWRDVVREAHPLLRQLASTWGETASLVKFNKVRLSTVVISCQVTPALSEVNRCVR